MPPTTRLNTTPPIAPPKPTSPATAPTLARGNRSVGTIITSVDHDCCPKNAIENSTSAHSTGARVTNAINGITDALAPSAILRAAFTERPCWIRRLGTHPPARPPTPPAAKGIHAKPPPCFPSNRATCKRSLGGQEG